MENSSQRIFSIIVVCLNAGSRLEQTLESIFSQTYQNYEVIIKDGLSEDGSADSLPQDERITVIRQSDAGIYDAMNQAVSQASGEYIYFLNCGDVFYDSYVLEKVSISLKIEKAREGMDAGRHIFYGDIYERKTGQQISSNPRINAFACYRNVPCHQACFYDRKLLSDKPFDISYRVRADYEHFLWCFFRGEANMVYLPFLIADYEGGGFSETEENRRKSAKEHKEITAKYMSRWQTLQYKAILLFTLSKLRGRLAENKTTAKLYNRLKRSMYR